MEHQPLWSQSAAWSSLPVWEVLEEQETQGTTSNVFLLSCWAHPCHQTPQGHSSITHTWDKSVRGFIVLGWTTCLGWATPGCQVGTDLNLQPLQLLPFQGGIKNSLKTPPAGGCASWTTQQSHIHLPKDSCLTAPSPQGTAGITGTLGAAVHPGGKPQACF